MLSKINRLKKKKEFDKVFKQGKGFRKGFLFLKINENNLGIVRFGFVVSQKISKKAVIRNKIKRRLREAVKIILPNIKKGADCVLVALSGLENKSFQEVKTDINGLFKKAGLLFQN